MTPCIARDGHLALAGDPPSGCVGCGQAPGALLRLLGGVYPPAVERARGTAEAGPEACADLLTELVREATEPDRVTGTPDAAASRPLASAVNQNLPPMGSAADDTGDSSVT